MRDSSLFNGVTRRAFEGATLAHLLAFWRGLTLKRLANFALVTGQYLIGTSRVRGHPYTATIDTNNVCNLRCALCPTGLGRIERKKGVMGLDEFKGYFDIFKEHIFILHLYAWGDPLLTPDLFEMIRYARKHKVFVSLATNLNAPESSVDRLFESGIDHVIIGLDGTTEEVYRTYRRGGDFKRVIENTRRLVQLKRESGCDRPLIQLQFLIFRHNQHQVGEMRTLGDTLGVDFVDVIKGRWAGKWAGDSGYFSDLEGLQEKDTKSRRCIYPWNKVLVHWDGGIAPCPFKMHKKDDLGNLREQDFKSLWNGDRFARIRRQQRDPGSVKERTICNGCPRSSFP